MKSNKKQVIRLSESDLHRIVRNSVNKTLKEDYEPDPYDPVGGCKKKI